MIVLDGGLATELEAQGCDIGNELWSAGMLQSNPSAIVDAHLAFLEAGADIIISASYQASREGFMSLGLSEQQADDRAGGVERKIEGGRRYFGLALAARRLGRVKTHHGAASVQLVEHRRMVDQARSMLTDLGATCP